MPDPVDPSARLGLRLLAGAAVLVAAAALFGTIAEDVVTGARLVAVDAEIARWLHERATPGLTRWVRVVSDLHSTVAISCYAAVAALCLAFARHWRHLLALFLGVAGGLTLNVLMKLAFQRSRPVFEQSLVTLSSYSFPSGHVAGTTIFYGLAVVFVFVRTRRRALAALAALAAALAIAVVAFTRVYLGAHFLSDVLAGFAEGVAWLAIVLMALDAHWHRGGRAR